MPSRKIVSIFIVSSALVVAIIIASGKGGSTETISQLTPGGLLSEGPGKLPQNTNWLSDLTPITLSSEDISDIKESSTVNVTDEVSQALMANYLSLKQSGDLDDTSARDLIDQTLKFTDSTSSQNKLYTTADIVIIADNSQATIRSYGNDLGNAFKVNKPPQATNEILLFSQILQTQDKDKITELKNTALIYRHTILTMKNIKVPSNFGLAHLGLMNSIETIAKSIDDMTIIFDDPLRSMQGISSYQEGFGSFMASLVQIKQQIQGSKITAYKQGDGGYYLYYGI